MLSDAIKIGVPSLLRGLTAFFIASSTRGHEFEKERRRRREELIERSLDDLETSHATFELLADPYSAFCTYDEIPWTDDATPVAQLPKPAFGHLPRYISRHFKL